MAMQKYDEGESQLSLGQTNLDAGDMVMPRIKVVQAMSQEAQDNAAKVGDLFNTLTGENYGSELSFIPLLPFKQRIFISRPERRDLFEAALGRPLSEGDGLKCRSFDMYQGQGDPGILCNECPLSKWGAKNEPPFCSETYNVAAMNELGDLIILSFAKSSAKVGKQLFSMLNLQHERPWTRIYSLSTRKQQNDKGTFSVPVVKRTPERTPDELLKVAADYARRLTGMTIDVTPEEEPIEEGVTAPF